MGVIERTYTYTIQCSNNLFFPENTESIVKIIDDMTDPGKPENIIDQCGRSIEPILIGYEDSPDPIVINGTRIWTYRYNICSEVSRDWTHTYTFSHFEWLMWDYDPFETLLEIDFLSTKVFT